MQAMTVAELASQLGIDPHEISAVLNGAEVSPELAGRLATAFGTSPELWLQLHDRRDVWDKKMKAILGTETFEEMQRYRHLRARKVSDFKELQAKLLPDPAGTEEPHEDDHGH